MEAITKEFLYFNLIENCFIILFFIFFNRVTDKVYMIIINTIMFSFLNTILKILFPTSMIMQLLGIVMVYIYLINIYHTKILKSIIGVIIPFFVLLVCEMTSSMLYTKLFEINLFEYNNDIQKFLLYLPIRLLEYSTLLIIYYINKKGVINNDN